ncbi:hypothetical protein IDH44_00535 [Paenibacillus sp. IB182496]|uniref:DUF2157 domain-containing protein n=1 Tax=Paenibacillus sabuli TaxID=2772509 RepID=A0A927GQ98_9BACL|nr:hypothetical protein [Paenibacillus sabuli]MBD2843660.1 hypothetical protein [Paenibacillus sabuli]
MTQKTNPSGLSDGGTSNSGTSNIHTPNGGSADPTKREQALQDIQFMSMLIARNRRRLDNSPPFLVLWGLYMLIGFAGMQFDVEVWPGWYWSIGTVVASAISAVIGMRLPKESGNEQGGSYGWMFWVPFAAVLASGAFMMFTGIVRLEYVSLFWMMMIGIVYVALAPLLGRRPVLLGGGLIVLAMLTRLLLIDYQFLVLGLIGGGGTIATGLYLRARSKRHG